MKYQSGCPPDHFMEDGQLWGHPIYDWDVHMKTGFEWWINRIKFLIDHVDIVRVDHFNGFAKYWEVPAKDSTAVNGKWEKKGQGWCWKEGYWKKIEISKWYSLNT